MAIHLRAAAGSEKNRRKAQRNWVIIDPTRYFAVQAQNWGLCVPRRILFGAAIIKTHKKTEKAVLEEDVILEK